MSIVKLGWSLGKDSTYLAYLHLLDGDEVHAVNYMPMFTDSIPLVRRAVLDFRTYAIDKLSSFGKFVFHEAKGISYCDYVRRVIVRGVNAGKPYGFPLPMRQKCGFARDSKIKACRSVDIGYYDFEALGICSDEYCRFSNLRDGKRSLLVERGITEKDCYNACRDLGLLSPSYDLSFRDGCALCPNGSKLERSLWLSDYPEAYSILYDLESYVMECWSGLRAPLRGPEWFLHSDQLSFFDDVIN